MKKIFALLTVLVFSVVLAGMVHADSRSAADKLEAGRSYLKLLDQKIIRLRKEGKTALVTKMQAEKKGTIARMQAWKAEAEGAGAPAAPVAPKPPAPPRPVASAPAQMGEGLFGLGYDALISGNYISTGSGSLSGSLGLRVDLVFGDPFALGPLVGLAEKDVEYRVGLGYVQGGGAGLKVIPLYVDGIINLPADLLGGIASYVGGGLNYGLYGNGQTTGRYGAELYAGIKGDLGLGLGGDSTVELGYSGVRSNTLTVKGITLSVGQELSL
ncbi:MAG: hypothetical protein ABIE84_01660 [bacterium]